MSLARSFRLCLVAFDPAQEAVNLLWEQEKLLPASQLWRISVERRILWGETTSTRGSLCATQAVPKDVAGWRTQLNFIFLEEYLFEEQCGSNSECTSPYWVALADASLLSFTFPTVSHGLYVTLTQAKMRCCSQRVSRARVMGGDVSWRLVYSWCDSTLIRSTYKRVADHDFWLVF